MSWKIINKLEIFPRDISYLIFKFVDKRDWLKKRWIKIGDSEETRLMRPIILKQPNILNNALIDDELDYFKAHYEKVYKDRPEQALARACLCGSEQVADFLLLDLLKSSYTDEKYPYLLNYICASSNLEWAKTVTKEMQQKGLVMPKHICRFANYETADIIRKIFDI